MPEILDINAIEARLKRPGVLEKFDPTSTERAMERTTRETIGEIVSKDYRKARVFKSLGIDFSCGGNKTLRQACEEMGLLSEDVWRQLSGADSAPSGKEMEYLNWDIAFLANYIIQLHHRFVYNQTKFLSELGRKVADSNSERNPEIKQVMDLFADACKTLELNCHEEEKVLLPYIISLAKAYKNETKILGSDFGDISVPIYLIQAESKKVVNDFRQIRQLTNSYVAPAYASSFCPILYKLLAEYEDDMHLHLHLENNILFPKAMEMEEIMRSKQLIS